MAFDLSEEDYDLIDRFLDDALARHFAGNGDPAKARDSIWHLITLVAQGDENFRSYIVAALAERFDGLPRPIVE